MATTQPVASSQPRILSLAIFSTTLFVSAGLLFWLEPMFAKMALPVLGGTTAVWTTCMLFYQAMLLAGYAYANSVTRRVNPKWQAVLCAGLALAPLLILPFSLPAGRVPPVERNPIPWLLMILTFVVGLPFFVLSTIGPTLQKWFAGIGHPLSDDPYFLYAASNFGSMLGLLSYPILIEPRFRLAEQTRLWTYGYGALVVLMIACAVTLWRAPLDAQDDDELREPQSHDVAASSAPPLSERLTWLVLAFVPSSLMLGVTTVLTTEIPPIPMFWVLPLAIYLLSFILVFAKKPPLSHAHIAGRMPLLILAAIIPFILKTDWPLFLEVIINLTTLFVVAVACHGELAKRRPATSQLTRFYMWIAIGGVLGGLFNAVIAPLVFSTVMEFPLALIFAALLRQIMLPAAKRPRFNWLDIGLPVAVGALAIVVVRVLFRVGIAPGVLFHLIAFGPPVLLCLSFSKRPMRFALGFVALLLAGSIYTGVYRDVLRTERSFYGIYRIANDETGHYRMLFDGQTIHGMQSLDAGKSREPLSYYTRSGPVGQIFAAMAGSEDLKEVAVVGLGAGAMACYAAPGEEFTFYEIDPLVESIARDEHYFTFLKDCAPGVRVVLGDARISLKNAADQRYGVIVLDAFGADAIPVHLLTREAIQLYLAKLGEHGLLVFHISNRYLDLQRVLGSVVRDAGLSAQVEQDSANIAAGKFPSVWVVMARTKNDLGVLGSDTRWTALNSDPTSRVWSDDYSSILTVFKWD